MFFDAETIFLWTVFITVQKGVSKPLNSLEEWMKDMCNIVDRLAEPRGCTLLHTLKHIDIANRLVWGNNCNLVLFTFIPSRIYFRYFFLTWRMTTEVLSGWGPDRLSCGRTHQSHPHICSSLGVELASYRLHTLSMIPFLPALPARSPFPVWGRLPLSCQSSCSVRRAKHASTMMSQSECKHWPASDLAMTQLSRHSTWVNSQPSVNNSVSEKTKAFSARLISAHSKSILSDYVLLVGVNSLQGNFREDSSV